MATDEHFRKLENMMHSAPFVKLTGAKVVVTKGEAQITFPFVLGGYSPPIWANMKSVYRRPT